MAYANGTQPIKLERISQSKNCFTSGYMVSPSMCNDLSSLWFQSLLLPYPQEWKDEFLTWDPDYYANIEHLVVPPNKVWLPDLAIKNR